MAPISNVIVPPFWHPAFKRAFILDWDGVLADTRLDFTALRQRYFGGRIVPLTESAEALPSPLRDEILGEIRRIEMEGADRAVPVSGAHELIAWLKEAGKPWAVVSRNCRDSILLAAERCGIELPPVLLSREEPAVKPEPEALFLAAERLGADPRDCVMVGDFIYDMLGARRAAIRCVLVEHDPAEWACLADAAYPRLSDLLLALQNPNPEPLVPWEYRGLAEARGQAYLEAVNRYAWRLPTRNACRQAVRLARRGVIRLAVPEGAHLGMEEWQDSELPARFIDRPLASVLEETLTERWPCVQILSGTDLPLFDAPDLSEGELDALLNDAASGTPEP